MRVAVLGSGLMGSAIAWDLASSEDVDDVVAADIDGAKLKELRKRARKRKLGVEQIDVKNRQRLLRFLRDFDVAVAALPHGSIVDANIAAIQAGVNMVDIAFEDDQMKLDQEARKNGVLLIPGCGLAPGMSNVLVADGVRRLDKTLEAHIEVGGLPQNPEPPLGYRLLFSIKGLLREYLEKARMIRNGRILQVEPFSQIENTFFPSPVGKCETFYTDGLATLLYTMRNLKGLDEKTVRWPGHAEKIKFLIDAGFFATDKIRLNGFAISPMGLSSAILSKLLSKGDSRDVSVMRVELSGKKKGQKIKIRYELMDFYDEEKQITSMARTTGFTCSIVCRMVGRGEIRQRGVVPPELALDQSMASRLLEELSVKGVHIQETFSEG